MPSHRFYINPEELEDPDVDADYRNYLLGLNSMNPHDDNGGDYEEQEEEEEGDEMDVEDGDNVLESASSRVSEARISAPGVGTGGGMGECWGKTVEGEARPSSNGNGEAVGECSSQSDIDGLFCPICMQAWTGEGEHHICCLPCGHIYGMSCIKKWLLQSRNSRKCPQCNKKCSLKDVRKLFASRIVVIDEESEKKIQSLESKCACLETKCASFESKAAGWPKKEAEWHDREAIMHQQVQNLRERVAYLEQFQRDTQSRPLGIVDSWDGCPGPSLSGQDHGSSIRKQGGLPCSLVLQEELHLDGARLFDVDASGKILIIAKRLSGMGGMHSLTKMSLMAPHDSENIPLASCTKAVKDLHVSPSGGLTLLASLGKRLSVLSMESNNVVLSYELPAAAWSCAWDVNNSHYVYAGLQNGMLLVFDMRQTAGPMESMNGLTCNPVHTLQSLITDSSLPPGASSILSASSVGLTEWSFGAAEKGPYLIPNTDNQGVCISLAFSSLGDEFVASFRPKVNMSDEVPLTQPSLTPPPAIGHGLQGTHILFQRGGHRDYYQRMSVSAKVDSIRLPKSLCLQSGDDHFFACGDETTCEMVLQELPSFAVAQRLKPHSHPIRDVRSSDGIKPGLLGCLSEDKLQLFSSKLF